MRIESLNVYNFRNYEKLSIDFNEKTNVFIGLNGSGKTNLLESIYFLALARSHRAYIEKNVIKTDKNVMKISGNIISLGKSKKLEVIVNQKGKMVSINNNSVKKVSDYISNFTVLLFCPDDLDLIKGSPTERRRFLNLEIGQLDNKYLNYLNDYTRLIKSRNEYLKKIKIDKYDIKFLEVLNDQIISKALLIYKYRFLFFELLKEPLNKVFKNISGKDIEIKYKNSCDIEKYDEEVIKERLKNKLLFNLKKEIFQGSTLYGPHKDDFEVFVDGINVREYGSQGQQRLSVLSIKIGELEVFKKIKGDYPVLLLDDVFSELDIEKRNKLVVELKDKTQVFITSTDIKNISKRILDGSKIFKIEKGDVL